MDGGLVHASEEGTPQGSPLSPLLSNVMLDDLDWELERRGHRFVRYADDGRIYVRSERAGAARHGEHHAIRRAAPEAARQPTEVGGRPRGRSGPCWGFEFFRYRDGRIGVTVAPKALKRAQDRIRQLTTRNWGVSMERRIKEINRFTVGWTAYFAFADTVLPFEKLDEVAAPQAQAGALEGVEAPTNALPEPPRARYPRPRRPLMGGLAEGVLAHRRVLAAPDRPAQRLLAQDHGPERVHRSLPPFPGMLSEPPGADPHAGWCGRGQGEPGPYPIRPATGRNGAPPPWSCCPDDA